VTNIHPTLATSAVGTFNPYATSPASTSSTNPRGSHAHHTSSCILSSTTWCTTDGTTPILWPGLPPRQRGTHAPYFQAPVQPYLIGYPPTCWPQYLPYYAAPQGGFNEDSETAKPNRSTVWDPSKLTLLLSAASWPLTAGLASLQLIATKCHMLPCTSLTFPCFGGNLPRLHILNH